MNITELFNKISYLNLTDAYNKLKQINNNIIYKENLLSTKLGVKPNQLKEILVSTSIIDDSMINIIIANDKIKEDLLQLYQLKNILETYIYNQIEVQKFTDREICVAILKELYHLTDKQISKKLFVSERSVQRLYNQYKGRTDKDNSWLKE